jgi:hypothetical protein
MVKLKKILNEILLVEHFLNLVSNDERMKYLDIVWDLLQDSYKDIGGFKSSTKENLINETSLWKLSRRDGKITAVLLYTNKHGLKVIGGATDKSSVGKKDLFAMIADDVKFKRSWAEVSGAMEHLYVKFGAPKIPNDKAAEILNKQIMSLNPDGYHYTRLLSGHPHEKLLVGFIK